MSNLTTTQKSAYFIRKTPTSTSTKQPATTSPDNSSSTSNVLNIPGTRTSLHNNQLLTPIGIPSIDSFIGGGLPVGSVCLIGEDKSNTYTDIITRCFIAEGIVHKHAIYTANLNEELISLKQRIPDINKIETSDTKSSETDDLRIAWRYGQQPSNDTETKLASKSFQANYFVTNKFVADQEIQALSEFKGFTLTDEDKCNASLYDFNELNPLYVKLANEITQNIERLNLNVNKTKKYTNICRIVINSIGGLLWNDNSALDEDGSLSLCRFLIYLRSLLRHSLAVVVLTVPNDLVQSVNLFKRLSHLSDFVFTMDDSVSTASRLIKTEYNGLFRLSKLPHLNSLSAFQPETLDLAFFLKRKRLVVEQLHLPPDLGEGDDTQKGRTGTSSNAKMSCGSGDDSKQQLLDF